MSSKKLKVDLENAQIAKAKHFKGGVKVRNQSETVNIEVCKYIAIAAVDVIVPFGITHLGLIVQTKPSGCVNWQPCVG
jgi:hypothetical protein